MSFSYFEQAFIPTSLKQRDTTFTMGYSTNTAVIAETA